VAERGLALEGRVRGEAVGDGHGVRDALEDVDAARPVARRRLLGVDDGRVARPDAARVVEVLQELVRGRPVVDDAVLLELVVDGRAARAVDAAPEPEAAARVDLAAEREPVRERGRDALESFGRRADLCGKQPLVRVGPSNLETRLARSKRGLFGSFLDR